MKTYSVSEVAEMLNVNEETIRRWIRDKKLEGERAVGRGGNTILIEDVINFVNKHPKEYMLPMEAWLKEHEIDYIKNKVQDSDDTSNPTTRSAIAATAAPLIAGSAAATVPTSIAGTAGLAAIGGATAIGGPIGLAVGAAALATTAALKKKKAPTYEIQLVKSTAQETQNCSTDHIRLKSNSTGVEVSETKTLTVNVLDEIAHAKKLLDAGILTQDEFHAIKERLIKRL